MVCPLATLDIHVGTMCTVSPEMITRSGNTVCISTSTHNTYGSPAVFVAKPCIARSDNSEGSSYGYRSTA